MLAIKLIDLMRLTKNVKNSGLFLIHINQPDVFTFCC